MMQKIKFFRGEHLEDTNAPLACPLDTEQVKQQYKTWLAENPNHVVISHHIGTNYAQLSSNYADGHTKSCYVTTLMVAYKDAA